MKLFFRLLSIGLWLLPHQIWAGPPPPIMYHLPLTDFVRYAQVIAETDLPTARAMFADTIPGWPADNITFWRGSPTDTFADQDPWGWMVYTLRPQDSVLPPPNGERVWIFLIPNNAVSYGTYHIANSLQIIPKEEAEIFRKSVQELMQLTDNKATDPQLNTTLWHWVMRGLRSPFTSIRADAMSTISLSVAARQAEANPYPPSPYQNPSPGLPVADFPADARETLRLALADSIAAQSQIPLTYPTLALLDLAQYTQTTGITGLLFEHILSLIDGMENFRKGATIAETPEYIMSSVIYDAIQSCMLIEKMPGVTRNELLRTARLLVFCQRWMTEYIDSYAGAYYFNLPYDPDSTAAFLEKITGSPVPYHRQLERQIRRLYQMPYDIDQRTARKPLQTTLRDMTRETGEVLNFCNDLEISALTGNRNWWGCHKAEIAVDAWVLDRQPTDSTSQPIAIAPNPCKGVCTLEWKAESEAQRVTLTLTDAAGRQVWSQKHDLVRYAPVQQASIEFPAGLPAGNYILAVQYPDRQLTIRIMLE